jgi:hypothetical protein
MSFATRYRQRATERRTNALWRYRTKGGSTVTVSKGYIWRCLGCDMKGTSLTSTNARRDANGHASACRAMPKPEATS